MQRSSQKSFLDFQSRSSPFAEEVNYLILVARSLLISGLSILPDQVKFLNQSLLSHLTDPAYLISDVWFPMLSMP
jgi:hypothetical protein